MDTRTPEPQSPSTAGHQRLPTSGAARGRRPAGAAGMRRIAAYGLAAAAITVLATACRPAPVPPPLIAPAVLIPPLHDAAPNEELRLRRGKEEWVWRVLSTTDTEVEVEFRIVRDGEPSKRSERYVWSRNGFGLPEGFVVREFRRDRIEISGRAWDCWLLRLHSRGGIRHYWLSEEAPVHGLLRMAVDEAGSPNLETATEYEAEASSFGGSR